MQGKTDSKAGRKRMGDYPGKKSLNIILIIYRINSMSKYLRKVIE